MATYGKKLLDVNGNIILPKTRSSLVYMDDNSTVEDKITSILSEITKIKDGTTIVKNAKQIVDGNDDSQIYQIYSSDGSGNNVSIFSISKATNIPVECSSRAISDELGRSIHNTYMPVSGGQFTGNVVGYNTARAGGCLRNFYVRNSGGTNLSSNAIVGIRQ